MALIFPFLVFALWQGTCHQVKGDTEHSAPGIEDQAATLRQLVNTVHDLRSELAKQQDSMQEVQELVLEQQGKIQDLEGEVKQQKDLVQRQQGKVQNLEAEAKQERELVQRQQGRIQDLDAEVKQHNILNTKQQQEIQEAKQEREEVKEQQEKQENTIQGMKAAMAGQKDTVKSQTKVQQEITVAFSAYHEDGDVVYQEGQRIPFTGTKFNSGSYNTTNSAFTCPVNGIYFFMTNIHFILDDLASGETVIVRGSEKIGMAFAFSNLDNKRIRQTCTTSAVTRCDVGEQLFVEASEQSHIGGSSSGPRTSFVGFLLALE